MKLQGGRDPLMQNALMCQQGCRKRQPPSTCMRLGRLFIHLWERPDEGRIVPSVPQLPLPPASSTMGNTSTVCCHGATRVPLLSCWGHLSCLQVLCVCGCDMALVVGACCQRGKSRTAHGQSLCPLLLAPRSGPGLFGLATSPRNPPAC